MNQTTKKMTIILPTIILLGAGCLPFGTTTTPTSTSTVRTLVQRQPIKTVDPLDHAYNRCTDQGYRLLLRFDTKTHTTKGYCQFSDDTECEAVAFANGVCAQDRGAEVFAPSKPTNIRQCEPLEAPVCGTDGNTYVNVCIASLQQVPVLHNGACAVPPPKKPTIATNEIGSNSVSSQQTILNEQTIQNNNIPSWIQTIKSLSEKSGSIYKTIVESCQFGDQTVYYQYESCPTCFDTLYNGDGDVICFPKHDLGNRCPSYFQVNNRPSCKKIE